MIRHSTDPERKRRTNRLAWLRFRALTSVTAVLAAVIFNMTFNVAPIDAARSTQDSTQTAAGAPKTPAQVGTIKSISGNNLVLTSDAGAEVNVDVRDSTKIVRIAPGQKDLTDAQGIALTDLQVGDRILVRGKAAEDGKTFSAASIIAMKKADIADKQSREREEWQKSGVGGLVDSVDAASGVINVTVPSLREKKNVAVRVNPQTILRRYAPGSVKFDDAKPAPLQEIRPGDQLRARGQKSRDGSELTATEVVSGSFRNISGTISSLDAAQNTITVHDLVTKKAVAVKIAAESQLRKLPAPVAQRIAQRLKSSSSTEGAAQRPPGAAALAAPTAKEPADSDAGQTRGAGFGAGHGRGTGPGGGGGAIDLQQMISRMPASSIADLQKGDAVMLVATQAGDGPITAITLLAGVEPILQGSPSGEASSILTPWSLSSAPTGESGTP